MKNLRRFRHLGASARFAMFAMFAMFMACGRIDSELRGPTDAFRGFDTNHDGEIDRFEWESSQGALFPASLGFRYADCDSDGRLTWHEYFTGYMHPQHCPSTYLYEPVVEAQGDQAGFSAYVTHEDDALGENWREAPLLVRADETVQIYGDPLGDADVPTYLPRALPPRPGHYSESELSPAERQRLRFSSGPVTNSELVSRYDPKEKIPGNEVRMVFPRLVCEIANDNAATRITMADVQVVWRSHGSEFRARWLKTLWTDPKSAQDLTVWFSHPVDSAECRLLHARGQRIAGTRG